MPATVLISPHNSLVKMIPIFQVRKQRPREIQKPGLQWGLCHSPCPKHKAVPYSVPGID